MGHTASALRYGLFTFFPDQFFSKLPEIDADLTGRTFLITGSNTGLGLASAIHLARMRASHLVLGVRDLNKGAKAKEEIIAQTKFAGTIDVWELDMTRFDSVKSFAERTNRTLSRLDGAMINAGIPNPARWDMTSDGWEKLWVYIHLQRIYSDNSLQLAGQRDSYRAFGRVAASVIAIHDKASSP